MNHSNPNASLMATAGAQGPGAAPDPTRQTTSSTADQGPAAAADAASPVADPAPPPDLVAYIRQELQQELPGNTSHLAQVATRFATEVERICRISQRIQASGQVEHWQRSLAQHRVQKCLAYFQLGSQRGRVELHSALSAIAYRYIAPRQARLGFEGRRTLLEDFLQGFYIEALKAFRREHAVSPDYSPSSRLQLAEYMTFTEQYAKRRISIPGAINQQIIVLRAQTFARRLPAETNLDLDRAMDSPKADDMDAAAGQSAAMQQVREQMVTEAVDPADQVLRDRIIQELITYLEEQNQQDCIDYFVLRLQDLPASEIDEILDLTARQRDYLQQRFKYHVEKFAQVHHWDLVHQWLGIDLEHNLGLSAEEWQHFIRTLSPLQRDLLDLQIEQVKTGQPELDTTLLSELLGCTPKRVQRTWSQILSQAWRYRNQKNS